MGQASAGRLGARPRRRARDSSPMCCRRPPCTTRGRRCRAECASSRCRCQCRWLVRGLDGRLRVGSGMLGHGASASITGAGGLGWCGIRTVCAPLSWPRMPPSLVDQTCMWRTSLSPQDSLPQLHRVVVACALERCAWRGLSLGLWVVPLASTSWRSRRSIGSWSRPSGRPQRSSTGGRGGTQVAGLCPFSPRSRCVLTPYE